MCVACELFRPVNSSGAINYHAQEAPGTPGSGSRKIELS